MASSSADLSYEQFVVIAETEWKLLDFGHASGYYGSIPQFQLVLKIGSTAWKVTSKTSSNAIQLVCQTVAEGAMDEVHLELFGYHRKEPAESYVLITDTPMRHIFTPSANVLPVICGRDTVFTVRVLKDRPMFPDFTLESTVFGGRFGSNGKLHVGGQVFHINKQLLSVHSEFFDRMFNSQYIEASQEEVELKREKVDPAVFHDFLLVMCVLEALPNPKNVAALSNLAKIYQAENVRNKCQQHLSMCHEMPMEQRFMLALENGNKELQTSIQRNLANLEESNRIIGALAKKAVAL